LHVGEAVATLAIIVVAVVIMRRRGEGWLRTGVAAVVAWLASAVVIVLWEVVFALAVSGYMMQQPAVVPSAGEPSGSSRVTRPSATSAAFYSPTPHPLPPTLTPVAPRIDFPVGTVVLVNTITSSPPMRATPSNEGKLVEWLRAGDRLEITGDYVVDEEEGYIFWPVRNPDSGKLGYLFDLFVDKEVIAGTND
jgi:hypothetical protein